MPGKHSDKTKLLGFFAHDDLVEGVDKARGSTSRSQFLREAVVELMRARGVDVPEELINAPNRTGKGGPKRKTKPDTSASDFLSQKEGPVPPAVLEAEKEILDAVVSELNRAEPSQLSSADKPKSDVRHRSKKKSPAKKPVQD